MLFCELLPPGAEGCSVGIRLALYPDTHFHLSLRDHYRFIVNHLGSSIPYMCFSSGYRIILILFCNFNIPELFKNKTYEYEANFSDLFGHGRIAFFDGSQCTEMGEVYRQVQQILRKGRFQKVAFHQRKIQEKEHKEIGGQEQIHPLCKPELCQVEPAKRRADERGEKPH